MSKNTEKIITFTEQEKQMIIHSYLLPEGATEVEIDTFINVCEKYGFDPLQKDVIFTKFESKNYKKVSYIVTKDAWLKHAQRQSNFAHLLKGVVYENDAFEIDFIEGTIKHKATANRGNIVGAWALLKTKDGDTHVENVNFAEYYQALSGLNKSGKPNVWDTIPSKMIEKTAISNVIKNVYPLGIMFRGEEEIEMTSEMIYEPNNDKKLYPAQTIETIEQKPQTVDKDATETETSVQKNVAEPKREEVTNNEPSSEEVATKPTENVEIVESIEKAGTSEELPSQEANKEPSVEEDVYEFLTKVNRTSATGITTTVVTAQTSKGQVKLNAIDEFYTAFDGFVQGDKFRCTFETRFHTLKFVTSLERI